MSTRMHVLMVLESSYPAPRGGGAEGQVRTLARGLRARGQRVTVLAPMLARGPQQTVGRVDGVPVCRLPYPHIRVVGTFWLWAVAAHFLWRRRHRYDAWHVHIAHHLAGLCAILGQLLDKRVLTKVAGSWELENGTLAPSPKPLDRIAGYGLRHTETWQAISRRMAATLASRGIPPARIAAVPNAVDTDRFAHLHPPHDTAARFLFIGRLEPEKCLDGLLDAFAAVVPRHPEAFLRIVGTGRLRGELEQQARDLRIEQWVEFAGHHDDVTVDLAWANISVLCSRIEGLSNTLLESMASGLPMVASRISGNEDFVRDGENGWLFEAGDAVGLARALDCAAATPSPQRRLMGEEARVTVRRQAGIDQVVTRLLTIYSGERTWYADASLPNRSV